MTELIQKLCRDHRLTTAEYERLIRERTADSARALRQAADRARRAVYGTRVLIRGAVENARPDLVIAVDALAARSCDRLACTVQLSDRGISPGSGIGNFRQAICTDTVGVPVLALGVPTVVDSSTLVYDALAKAKIGSVSDELRRVLENGRSFFVSPKESDVITAQLSTLFAEAISLAFTVRA